MQHSFNVKLKGRVKNFELSVNKENFLVPIYEAISNSLHAIDNFCDDTGKIDIKVERENDLSTEINKRQDGNEDIKSIVIKDNGVGFNNVNMNAFMESDTENKIQIGGKGVGRLSWLKVFNKISIKSCFINDDGFKCSRKFDFDDKSQDIDDALQVDIDNFEQGTSIVLDDIKQEYKKFVKTKSQTIATAIIKHCIKYFISKKATVIRLIDGEYNEILNDLYKEKVDNFIDDEYVVKVKEHDFYCRYLKVKKEILEKHELVLLGHERVVETVDLSKYIIDLPSIIDDEYKFICIVKSNYLDDNVDSTRTRFMLNKEQSEQSSMYLTINEIIDCIVKFDVNERVKGIVEPIRKERKEKVIDYVKRNPKYKHLIESKPDIINKIKAINDASIDNELNRANFEFENEQNEIVQQVRCELKKENLEPEVYEKKFKEIVEASINLNKTRLADYVTHRKTIIDLFEDGLNLQDDGKYSREAYMHNLIYNMHRDSFDIDENGKNLWLIDERLSYYFYASSDIHFNNDKKEERPDIMLFDKPIVLTDKKNTQEVYDRIVLFELKKPMRHDLHRDAENPLKQILGYKRKIEDNEVLDKQGRYIKVNESTKYYLYVVCDIAPKFKKEIKENHNLTETIDGLGFYRMDNNLYIEVLTYDKILNDAKKRNEILFEKLGLH
ncbi:MAG: ATP-binding protein [Firmicutes bacterium]|nr:ATP-binding protein [Bacillota bacterium]MCL1953950.1 ATP-binding protein [Bacillota bacterium]